MKEYLFEIFREMENRVAAQAHLTFVILFYLPFFKLTVESRGEYIYLDVHRKVVVTNLETMEVWLEFLVTFSREREYRF